MLNQWSTTAQLPPFKPRCRSIMSTHDPLVPLENDGWQNVTHNGKTSWEAKGIDKQISFSFESGAYNYMSTLRKLR